MALRLANRNNPPPNGFLWHEKETNWRNWQAQPTSVWDFKLLCREIQKHRQANPRFRLTTDLTSIANEVDLNNAQRVATIPGSEAYLINDSAPAPPPKTQAPLTLSERLQGAVADLKKVNAGRVMLLDWETAGYPQVTQDVAERRATICSSCPKNEQGNFTRWFTVPASERIQAQIERLKEVKLFTTKDDQLSVCTICLCPMRLKVHSPIEFIARYMSPEQRQELAAVQNPSGGCWVCAEIK